MAKTTVAEHLKGVHEAMGAHHGRMAKLAKGQGDKDAQAEHQKMATYHEEMAEKCASGMDKAISGRDAYAIVPDGVSSIPTTFAVPRFGAPEVGKAKVAPEFQHLVETQEG